MSRKEHVTLTNMCMITDGDHVLVQNKILKDHTTGITFPGGHVEANEPITDSLIREVYEETGLTIYDPHFAGIKDWIEEDGDRYIVFLYTADTFTGTLHSSHEGEVFWVPLSSLANRNCIWHLDQMLKVFTRQHAELFLFGNDFVPVLK